MKPQGITHQSGDLSYFSRAVQAGSRSSSSISTGVG